MKTKMLKILFITAIIVWIGSAIMLTIDTKGVISFSHKPKTVKEFMARRVFVWKLKWNGYYYNINMMVVY